MIGVGVHSAHQQWSEIIPEHTLQSPVYGREALPHIITICETRGCTLHLMEPSPQGPTGGADHGIDSNCSAAGSEGRSVVKASGKK